MLTINLLRPALGRGLEPFTRFLSFLNEDQLSAVGTGLRDILDEKDISTAESVLQHHCHDESWHRGGYNPDFVVSPRYVGQVSDVCTLCNSHDVPIIPYGTGTGVEGGIVALRGGVCVNLANIDSATEVRASDFNAFVGAGVTRLALDDHLRGTGLFFPVDPGADASVCGMASTNASGTNAVKSRPTSEKVFGGIQFDVAVCGI